LHKHGIGVFSMTPFIYITYKNTKPLRNHVNHIQFCEWQQTMLQMCLTFRLLTRAMYRIWYKQYNHSQSWTQQTPHEVTYIISYYINHTD